MSTPKTYHCETKNFDCEFQIPPSGKEPFEIMFTNLDLNQQFLLYAQ